MVAKQFYTLGYDTRYWWLLLSGGIFFIGMGIWIIFTSAKSYLFLSILLALGMLSTGAFEACFSLFHLHKIKGWGWIFAGGMIDTLLGVYLLKYPLLTMLLMPMVIGIWMLFRAFVTLSSPISLKTLGIRHWIWLIFISMILILPSIVILIDPFIGFVNMVIITGIAFILSGFFRILFSQQLRKLKSGHMKIIKRNKRIAKHNTVGQ